MCCFDGDICPSALFLRVPLHKAPLLVRRTGSAWCIASPLSHRYAAHVLAPPFHASKILISRRRWVVERGLGLGFARIHQITGCVERMCQLLGRDMSKLYGPVVIAGEGLEGVDRAPQHNKAVFEIPGIIEKVSRLFFLFGFVRGDARMSRHRSSPRTTTLLSASEPPARSSSSDGVVDQSSLLGVLQGARGVRAARVGLHRR